MALFASSDFSNSEFGAPPPVPKPPEPYEILAALNATRLILGLAATGIAISSGESMRPTLPSSTGYGLDPFAPPNEWQQKLLSGPTASATTSSFQNTSWQFNASFPQIAESAPEAGKSPPPRPSIPPPARPSAPPPATLAVPVPATLAAPAPASSSGAMNELAGLFDANPTVDDLLFGGEITPTAGAKDQGQEEPESPYADVGTSNASAATPNKPSTPEQVANLEIARKLFALSGEEPVLFWVKVKALPKKMSTSSAAKKTLMITAIGEQFQVIRVVSKKQFLVRNKDWLHGLVDSALLDAITTLPAATSPAQNGTASGTGQGAKSATFQKNAGAEGGRRNSKTNLSKLPHYASSGALNAIEEAPEASTAEALVDAPLSKGNVPGAAQTKAATVKTTSNYKRSVSLAAPTSPYMASMPAPGVAPRDLEARRIKAQKRFGISGFEKVLFTATVESIPTWQAMGRGVIRGGIFKDADRLRLGLRIGEPLDILGTYRVPQPKLLFEGEPTDQLLARSREGRYGCVLQSVLHISEEARSQNKTSAPASGPASLQPIATDKQAPVRPTQVPASNGAGGYKPFKAPSFADWDRSDN